MKEEFVTYEQEKALKELGFDEPCLLPYTTAPLRQQALRWFRKKYKDVFYIKMSGSYTYYINLNQKLIGEFETYEEAENFLINELLNISNYGQSNT